jgi:hypothetical protein
MAFECPYGRDRDCPNCPYFYECLEDQSDDDDDDEDDDD